MNVWIVDAWIRDGVIFHPVIRADCNSYSSNSYLELSKLLSFSYPVHMSNFRGH